MMKEAYNYTRQPDGKTDCLLCPNRCTISPGNTGLCRQYQNIDSILYSVSYGTVATMAIDPIEKKPLYHYYPGGRILSLGAFGCNLSCSFCQNHDLSFGSGKVYPVTPEELMSVMKQHALTHLAFTYNEPIVHYEFILDTFQALKKHSFQTVLVTNGFIEESPLERLLHYTDAMNIDWKGPSSFYQSYCFGSLEPVRKTIRMAQKKSHIEITYLLIPDGNDKESDLMECRDFLSSLSPFIPVHLNRYFPHYQMTRPPTPVSALLQARAIFLQSMPYVYIGNADLPNTQNTYCHHCHSILIKRTNYDIYYTNILDGKCQVCGEKVNMILGDSVC